MSGKQVLTLHNVSKSFYRDNLNIKVLHHVNMFINQGEMVGLVGESGSGKSTLINMIARLDQPDEGEISLNGHLYSHRQSVLLNPKDVQIVFQEARSSFDPRKTIGYSIAEPLIVQGTDKKDAFNSAMNLLEECGLDLEFVDAYPHELSGGQCQRAAIARAIAASPSLICLDECTSALDPLSSTKIVSMLVELKEKHRYSCLFVSHNDALVRYYCDRIYCLQQGKLALMSDDEEK